LILLPRLRHFGYVSTPKNSLAFACTGGEGVHFSFLVANATVDDDSPVICTVPCAFGRENHIVGRNIFDFLCLGYYLGYFGLEQLGYDADKTIKVFGSGSWKPQCERDWLVGFGVNQEEKKVLNYLIEQCGLMPWKSVKRKFKLLQKKYLPLLDLSGIPG
jgi:hypothetical protein